MFDGNINVCFCTGGNIWIQSRDVTLDISGSPVQFQWGSRKYPLTGIRITVIHIDNMLLLYLKWCRFNIYFWCLILPYSLHMVYSMSQELCTLFTLCTLKRLGRQFDIFFVIGGTASCHYDNLRGRQRRQSYQMCFQCSYIVVVLVCIMFLQTFRIATLVTRQSWWGNRSVYAPSQRETVLQCNAVSHWLGA